MIKKLLLIFSFIILATIAFNGTTYAIQTGEIIVITEELSKLNKLYKEGFITEEEFSKAKSILLDSASGTTEKEEKKWWQWPDEEMEEMRKAVILKKKKLSAVEWRDLEELKAAKEAERKRKSEERKRQAEEEELAKRTCKDNSEVKCPSTVLGTLKKLNIFKKN